MSSAERTEVLKGLEKIIPVLLKFYSNATTRVDIMAGFSDVRKSSERRPLLEAYADLGKRHIKMRAITRIDKDNLQYIGYLTEFIGKIEFRHLNDVRGAFAVSDKEYVVSPSAELLSTGSTQAVFSNARARQAPPAALRHALGHGSADADQGQGHPQGNAGTGLGRRPGRPQDDGKGEGLSVVNLLGVGTRHVGRPGSDSLPAAGGARHEGLGWVQCLAGYHSERV